MRYQVVDQCREPDCRCEDAAGVVLYDGPDYSEAIRIATTQARYPSPVITPELIRDTNHVYTTEAEAIAAGYVAAEFGWWVPQNGDITKASEGWVGLLPRN